ncbi:MAG: ExbD/TolR family protein [Opitutales bacterium]
MKIALPETGDDKFDLTSMIDVVFILIFFFMLVAAEITNVVEIEMPVADRAVIPENLGTRPHITVVGDTYQEGPQAIDPTARYYLGLKPHTLEELVTRVVEDRAAIADFVVYIRGDSDVAHRHVRRLMQALAEQGVTEVTFATLQVPD